MRVTRPGFAACARPMEAVLQHETTAPTRRGQLFLFVDDRHERLFRFRSCPLGVSAGAGRQCQCVLRESARGLRDAVRSMDTRVRANEWEAGARAALAWWHPNLRGAPILATAGNLSVPRSVFETLGGFDTAYRKPAWKTWDFGFALRPERLQGLSHRPGLSDSLGVARHARFASASDSGRRVRKRAARQALPETCGTLAESPLAPRMNGPLRLGGNP